jgi:hypothetical protein
MFFVIAPDDLPASKPTPPPADEEEEEGENEEEEDEEYTDGLPHRRVASLAALFVHDVILSIKFRFSGTNTCLPIQNKKKRRRRRR